MKTEILFEEANFEIGYNPEAKILHINWKGEQNIQSIKRGCEKILEFMQARECIKVVNDNTQINQPWVAVENIVAEHI